MPPALTRIRLIAGREFTAYVASLTFWVALALGPVAMAALLALAQMTPGAAPRTAQAQTVSVAAPDPATRAAAADAVQTLAALSGTPLVVTAGPASAHLRLARREGQLTLEVIDGQTLFPPLARAFLLDRIALRTREGGAHPGDGPPAPLEVTRTPAPVAAPASTALATRRIGQFALATLLWMTLTGSMGMLLQAVVRERSHRGLETLLAMARPIEIVLGKLVGVGAVSVLVVGAWIGSGAALAALAPHASGLAGALMSGLSNPQDLVRAAAAYVLAYLLYGLATVAIGATAGDTAAAQNLSRPLFAVLIAVFFAVTAAMSGTSDSIRWLVYAPPFTPFLLILDGYSWGEGSIAVILLLLAILGAGVAAQRATRLKN